MWGVMWGCMLVLPGLPLCSRHHPDLNLIFEFSAEDPDGLQWCDMFCGFMA